MSKKAQEQVQFNWIYIAVVGAIILLIFVNIASGIRKNSKTQLAVDAITYFDEIFTSAQASENTENSITLAGLELEVASDAEDCNFYTIKGTNLGGRSTEFTPLFSPGTIKKTALAYSMGWDMPFRVNYFLYLSSPDIAYVSVGSNSIFGELPEHLTTQKAARSDDFVNQNYYKVKFFSTNENSLSLLDSSVRKLKDDDATAVYINEGSRTIKFFRKNGAALEETGVTYYVDKPTMIAAIYSESMDAYECNLKKAVKRLNRFSAILKGRLGAIKAGNLLPGCSASSYTDAETILAELEQATESGLVSKQALDKIYSTKEKLQSLNRELNKKSCPTVY